MAKTAHGVVPRTGHPHERVVAALGAVTVAIALASLPTQLAPVAVPAGADVTVAPAVAAPGAPAGAPAPATLGLTDTVPAPAPLDAVDAPPIPVPTTGPAPEPVAAQAPAAPVPLPGNGQERADDALDGLGYPWQELGWSIRFEPYRGGLLGLADPSTRTITVFVKPRSTVQQLRVVLAHEIGHALDHRYEEQRGRYREVRGIPADRPWFPCPGCEDYDSPAGDFAEVFAVWLVGPADFRSRVAPLPDERQLRELAPLFQPPSGRPQVQAPPPPPAAPSPSPSPTRKRDLIDISPR